MVDPFTQALRTMPFAVAALCALAWNIAAFCGAVAIGEYALRIWHARRITPTPPAITGIEPTLALSCVTINALITVAGIGLWKADVIGLRQNAPVRVLADAAVLFLAMDVGMYV